MITKKFKFLLITAFAFSVAGFLSQANIEINAQTRFDQAMRKAEVTSGDEFTVTVKTPQGANIYAVRQPSSAMLRAIDKGLSELFSVARKNNYRSRLNHSDYTIFIARPDRRNNRDGAYSPGIAIPNGQYAGSVYDQWGVVYVAGKVISFNPSAFIISDYDREFNQVSDIVRYEGEHIVLYHNDRRRFRETADHSRGGSHPILN